MDDKQFTIISAAALALPVLLLVATGPNLVRLPCRENTRNRQVPLTRHEPAAAVAVPVRSVQSRKVMEWTLKALADSCC